MSPAADLVAKLAAAGTEPELLAIVAQQLFAGENAQAAIDARRSNDRDRKARKSREVTGTHVNGAEIRDTLSPQSPPLKSTPDPEKITPPLTPQSSVSSAEPPSERPLTADEIVEAWNERMVPQGFPAVKRLTETRRKHLKARLRENTIEDWQQAMAALERSEFCRGNGPSGWIADFDFLLQPKSFTKLLEGAYDH